MPRDDTPASAAGDELFGLPVGEFITGRDTLVRRLKADGARDEAAAVKALRRPTLAAWAVNQVVRADPETGDRLVAAAHAIERAQRRALSGVRDGSLREASATRRRLVEELVDRAAGILVAAGSAPASHLDDVGRTFEAASSDPVVAARVAQGCLSAPVHPRADFAAVAGLTEVAPVAPPDLDDAGHGDDLGDADPELVARRRTAIRKLEAATTRAEASATQARAARQEATTLADRADAARRAADDARRRADEAREVAARAATTASDLQAQSDQAASEAASAAARARATAEAAARARSALDDLG